jgi:hypothetical protein
MFSNEPYVHALYRKLLGSNVHWQDREAWIYSKRTYTRYPFQGALYGLPPDVLKECIVGAIEARFGALKNSSDVRPCQTSGNSTASALKSESLVDCCGDGVAEATTPLGRSTSPEQVVRPVSADQHRDAENFEQFIYRVWGAGVARHFAIPYNRKLWAVPLAEMETSWLGGRVPMPDLDEMIEGALQPVAKPQGRNARFGYPLRGGFQALMNGFLPLLEGELLTRRQGRENRSTPSPRHPVRRAYVPLSTPDQHRAVTFASGNARKFSAATGCRSRRQAASRLCALRQSRRRPGEHLGEALDLLSGGHRFSSHLRPGQCKSALQSARWVWTDLRDNVFAPQAVAL